MNILNFNKLKAQGGFTLTELLIVLAIIAILATFALPSYNEQIAKGRRADAKNTILELVALQERHYSNFGFYGSATDLRGVDPIPTDGGHYSVAISCTPNCTAASRPQQYLITATVSATDTNCGNFTYDQSGQITESGTKEIEYCW